MLQCHQSTRDILHIWVKKPLYLNGVAPAIFHLQEAAAHQTCDQQGEGSSRTVAALKASLQCNKGST